jgi:hypothetical protein
MIPPSATPRSGFENLFWRAFSGTRHNQFTSTNSIDSAPNEACGDSLDPDFEGLYVWSNNVNTLSLANDCADLHELCRQFKEFNIGLAAFQELNIDMQLITNQNFPAASAAFCSLVVGLITLWW